MADTKKGVVSYAKVRTDNSFRISGRIAAEAKAYGEGKAANVSVYDRGGNLIQLKSFSPKLFGILKAGMPVEVIGHIAPNSYEKNGETVYSQDLVADTIDIREGKAATNAREAKKAAATE